MLESTNRAPIGMNVTLSCDDKFLLVPHHQSLQCDSVGKWSPNVPTCEPGCNKADLPDNSVFSTLTGLVMQGTNMTISCVNDTLFNTTKTPHTEVECVALSTWSPSVACVPACNTSYLIDSSVNANMSTLVFPADHIVLNCSNNTVLNTTKSQNAEIACLANSTWNSSAVGCIAMCNISALKYITINNSAEIFVPGDLISIHCQQGLTTKLQDGSIVENVTATCTNNSDWQYQNFTCQADCRPLSGHFLYGTKIFYNENRTEDEKYAPATIAMGSCLMNNVSHSLAICQINGTWNINTTDENWKEICPAMCDPLGNSPQAWSNYTYSNNITRFWYAPETMATIRCHDQSRLGNHSTKCQTNGKWQALPNVQYMACPTNVSCACPVGWFDAVQNSKCYKVTAEPNEIYNATKACRSLSSPTGNLATIGDGISISDWLQTQTAHSVWIVNSTRTTHWPKQCVSMNSTGHLTETLCTERLPALCQAPCGTTCKNINVTSWWKSVQYTYPHTAAKTYLPDTVANLFCPSNNINLSTTCRSDGNWLPNPDLEACPEAKCKKIPAEPYWTLMYNPEFADDMVEGGTVANLLCQSLPSISNTTICTNGNWTSYSVKHCPPVTCEPTTVPTNWTVTYDGTLYNTSWIFNTIVTFSCPEDQFRETITRTCDYSTGLWTGVGPDKPCPSIACKSLKPDKFWSITYSTTTNHLNKYNHSTEAVFECYKTNTSMVSTCHDGKWTLEAENLTECLPAHCMLANISGYWLTNNDTCLHNTTKTFHCIHSNKTVNATCINGAFDKNLEQIGHCPAATCPPVSSENYWTIRYSTSVTGVNGYEHKTVVTLACPSTGKEEKVTCSNSQWSPKLNVTTCPAKTVSYSESCAETYMQCNESNHLVCDNESKLCICNAIEEYYYNNESKFCEHPKTVDYEKACDVLHLCNSTLDLYCNGTVCVCQNGTLYHTGNRTCVSPKTVSFKDFCDSRFFFCNTTSGLECQDGKCNCTQDDHRYDAVYSETCKTPGTVGYQHFCDEIVYICEITQHLKCVTYENSMMCGCEPGQKFDHMEKLCVSNRTCPADGEWPELPANRKVVINCTIGSKSRMCSRFADWQTPQYDNCSVTHGYPCHGDEKCIGNSTCEGLKCECPKGTEPRWNDTLGYDVCLQKYSYAYEPCNNGEICIGGSQCVESLCHCPNHTVVDVNETISKPVCATAFCDEERGWKRTAINANATVRCNGGQLTRKCHCNKTWAVWDVSHCKSDIFQSCAYGEHCLQGSVCTKDKSGTYACLCSYNTTSVEDAEKKIDQCKAVKSYANEPCDNGQVCQANSTCNGTVCKCSDGKIGVEHDALGKEVCTPPGECHTDEYSLTDRCSFVTEPTQWEKARDICQEIDSKLVVTKTQDEWRLFQEYRLHKSSLKLENIWLGLWYNKILKQYQWTDGTFLKNDHWMPDKFRVVILEKGFPTSEKDTDHCVVSRQVDNYEWTFKQCDSLEFLGVCDATIRFCPADLGWNKSLELTTHTQPCNEGQIKRECNAGGIWGSPIGSECEAYVSDSCTYGETCMGKSRCEADQSVNGATCQCDRGMTPVFDENDKLICRPRKVYPGDNCAHGEKCQNGSVCLVYCVCPVFTVLTNGTCKPDANQTKDPFASFVGDPCGNGENCQGKSVCFNNICNCLPGEEPDFDPRVQNKVCVHKNADPHQSCFYGETCIGNSTCNSSSICECTVDLPVFYPNDTRCVANYSMVTGPCDYSHPCHPITESKCTDGLCLCEEFRIHDVDFGMCIINQQVYDYLFNFERGIKKQYLETCTGNKECDKKGSGLICKENKCGCPEGSKVVDEKCEDYCGELGGYYMNNPDEWVGCKFPGKGQNCSGMCAPSTLSCINGTCVSPRAGEPCSFECIDSKTMRCISSNTRSRDAIRKTIEKYKSEGKKYNPKYLSQVTNTGICECLAGYTLVHETRTCESLPGRPTKRCSAHGVHCINGSSCNFDKAICECNAGTEPKENDDGLMVCRKIIKKPDEPCGNGELCTNGSDCNMNTKRCECSPGYAITKSRKCSRLVCEKEKEWAETNSLETSVQSCASKNHKGEKRRYCTENGLWDDEIDTCFPLTLDEFIEYLKGPRFQKAKGSAAACARMLDVYREFSNEIPDVEYGRKLMLAMELMVTDCPAGVILARTEIETELSDKFFDIMDTILNTSNKDVIESDLATAVTLLDQNAIVADALGQEFLENTMKQYTNKGFLPYNDKERRFNSSEFDVANFIIRPGQSKDAATESFDAICSIDSNTLRSPALLSHKDRFGMTCSMIYISVLLENVQATQVKLVAPLISVTTTLGWQASRDLMVNLKFPIEKELPKEKVQCGWLHKIPNVGPMYIRSEFRQDGCVILEVYENSVLCSCTADTKNYALRVEIDPPEKEESIHETIIEWLTRICLGTSVILLTITSLVLLYIRKFQTERIYRMRVLCVFSAFAQSVLLAGMHLTEYHTVCQILGIVIHFLSISVLTCQLCFAISLWRLTKCKPENFIQPNTHNMVFLLFTYLLPFAITLTTFLIHNDGYGGDYLVHNSAAKWITIKIIQFSILGIRISNQHNTILTFVDQKLTTWTNFWKVKIRMRHFLLCLKVINVFNFLLYSSCWPVNNDNVFAKYLTIVPMSLLSMISLILTLISLSKRYELESFHENTSLIAQSIRNTANLNVAISVLLPCIWISGTLIEIEPSHEWLLYLVRYLFALFNGIYGMTLCTIVVHYNMEVKIGILIQGDDTAKLQEILPDGLRPYYHF